MKAARLVRAGAAAALLGSVAAQARAAETDVFADLDAPPASVSVDGAGGSRKSPSAVGSDGRVSEAAGIKPPIVPAAATPSRGANPDGLLEDALSPESTGALPPHPALVPAPQAADPVKPAVAAGPKLDTGGLDPEPDAMVKAPISKPSEDPLDRASIPPAPQGVAQKTDALPPLNAALKTALDARNSIPVKGAGAGERRKERDAIAFFYAAHGFDPIWSKDGKAVDAVDGVLARLARAGDDALVLPNAVKTLTTQGTPGDIAASELAFTEAVVAYARQASGSRVDPQSISPVIGLRPQLVDPAELLDAVAGAGSAAGDKLRAQNPAEPRYVALRDKLMAVRSARTPTDAVAISAGPLLRVGMRDPRVPLLRARFRLEPNLSGQPDDQRFDAQLADALAGFQRVNGLVPSGKLTKRTLDALAGSKPSRMEGEIVANMELWRWMPHDLGADRIEVNVPDYVVTVFHNGAPVSHNRVVVGKLDTPTPLFSNAMKYLIVNPYWNVPQSIIKKEMLPKGGGDLSYLDGRGYSVGWHGGQWTVKQLPGEKNALGRIKFLFPNDYAVYLHDTPSKRLFSAAKRAFSHGCVRVDDPFAFGQTVLNDALPDSGHKKWSQQRLEDMIGEKEHYVNLPVPLPIHIEYFTASVDPDTGTLQTREDIYGYARAVAAALGQDAEPALPVAAKPREVAEHTRHGTADGVVDGGLDPR